MNKKMTQDGTKYSKLLSVLTPEARTRMVGHLPELGTHSDEYQRLKDKLKEAYTETKICLLYTSPSPRDLSTSRMPSSA